MTFLKEKDVSLSVGPTGRKVEITFKYVYKITITFFEHLYCAAAVSDTYYIIPTFLFFEIGSHSIVQFGFLLFQPSKCWDYMHSPPGPASIFINNPG